VINPRQREASRSLLNLLPKPGIKLLQSHKAVIRQKLPIKRQQANQSQLANPFLQLHLLKRLHRSLEVEVEVTTLPKKKKKKKGGK